MKEDRSVIYESIPDSIDFSTEFPIYVLAFCPDTCSWFATKQRCFYYEYPMDFPNEQAAIGYFKRNPDVFMNLEKMMVSYRPPFLSSKVLIENTRELISTKG